LFGWEIGPHYTANEKNRRLNMSGEKIYWGKYLDPSEKNGGQEKGENCLIKSSVFCIVYQM